MKMIDVLKRNQDSKQGMQSFPYNGITDPCPKFNEGLAIKSGLV